MTLRAGWYRWGRGKSHFCDNSLGTVTRCICGTTTFSDAARYQKVSPKKGGCKHCKRMIGERKR